MGAGKRLMPMLTRKLENRIRQSGSNHVGLVLGPTWLLHHHLWGGAKCAVIWGTWPNTVTRLADSFNAEIKVIDTEVVGIDVSGWITVSKACRLEAQCYARFAVYPMTDLSLAAGSESVDCRVWRATKLLDYIDFSAEKILVDSTDLITGIHAQIVIKINCLLLLRPFENRKLRKPFHLRAGKEVPNIRTTIAIITRWLESRSCAEIPNMIGVCAVSENRKANKYR